MKRWLPFIFLLLAAFSGPAITRQFAPAISDAGGATNQTQTLSWDAKGRLRLVMERNTNNYGFNWSAVYDGLNRRISTTIILVSNGVPSVVPPQMLSSYYDPQTECLELGVLLTAAPQQEFLQSEASPSIQTTWKLYGPDLNGQYGGLNGVGGLDAVSPYQNDFDPVISDARGNVLAEETNGVPYWTLARPTGYGAVPGYRPVAFGNGADMAQSSAWRGHEVDVTGFYYLYNRYYDPVGGQWLSFDPTPNDLDPNGQSFVGGDPVNYFDPDGRFGKQSAQETAHALSVTTAFLGDSLVNIGVGSAYLLHEGAYLGLGDPESGAAAQRELSEMSPFARQGYYNPNTPTAKLATAGTLLIAPESASGRMGTFETAVTRNITPTVTAESIQAEANAIQSGVANNSTRLLAAETAQSTRLLDTTLDPLPMGQDVLDHVVATDPALQNVSLSVVPTYAPYLGENVLGQATRDTAIDMQNEISSLAFQNRSSLVGTIVHEEMHLRIFQGAAEGNASYINLLQSGADEAYVQAVEARFLRLQNAAGR